MLGALLRQVGTEDLNETEMADEDRAWLDAGGESMAAALAEIEVDVSREEKQVWLAAFDRQAHPCVYVPGQGFVPVS